jgi:hypothetical protein
MPIEYESPAPIAAAAAIYQRLANRGYGVNVPPAFGGGGYGGGHGGYGGGPNWMQAAINHRDDSQFAQEQATAATQVQARDQFAQEQENSRQQQQFQLQAQLHDIELSQQERMRLVRMKNAVGEVSADPTLSDGEKAEMIAQLKTGISPLQTRLAKEKLQQEQLLKNSMAEEHAAKAMMFQNTIKLQSAKFDDRTYYHVDPPTLSKITDDILRQHPELQGRASPDEITEMARKEAMRQGLGTMMYQHEAGKWKPMSEDMPTHVSGGKGEFSHPTGLQPTDYIKALDHAQKVIDDKAKETVTDDVGNKKPAHPELQDLAVRQQKVQEYLKQAGLPSSFEEYKADLSRRTGKPAYQSTLGAGVAAGRDKGPGQEDNGWKPSIQQDRFGVVAGVDAEIGRAHGREDLPAETRSRVLQALQQVKQLVASSRDGSVGGMTEAQRQKYEELKKFLQSIPADPRVGANGAGGVAAAASPARVLNAPGGNPRFGGMVTR